MVGRGTMQSVIIALQQFWAERGCLIWQPYYTQVGAGTMNPATFLRVLGPEPWRVAYVEPSVRPDDARFGENPNRLQQHYQFQVILKPDPGNPQELYLQSLVAIGVDPARHDLRFVEDKWESPALGAWGLGWEVWLDGQEITQFTYFQQAGGQALEPVSVEITYGLERILIGMLALDHFKDIPWDDRLTYGDVLLQAEAEQSRYYVEKADIDRISALFSLHEQEAGDALGSGLLLPAYDNLLRCSHLFNVMDSRGAVGVTERAALFGRMRDLSRRISEAYLEQRRGLGFPWIGAVEASAGVSAPPPDGGRPPSVAEDFVLEIGTEELPAGDLTEAIAAIHEHLPLLLGEAGLDHGAVEVGGTPRRLTATVRALHPKGRPAEKYEKGPPESISFDAQGNPTPAAIGWARKLGLPADPAYLRSLIQNIGDGKYLAHSVEVEGRSADQALSEHVLPVLLRRLTFDQTMRWIGAPGDSPEATALRRTAFSRPIRWLLALHGEHVVPFEYAGLRSGRTTRSRRFEDPEVLTIGRASEYEPRLAAQDILLDPVERRQSILEQGRELAASVGGKLDVDSDLTDEVANMVEAPQALIGSYDSAFLSLPAEVLVAVMKKHQRYFPIRDQAGTLLPHFIAVRDGRAAESDTIRAGNEHVLRARFADAEFFLKKDREKDGETFRQKTALVTFQARLGSMLDKTDRIESLLPDLATQVLRLKGEAYASAIRAVHLCKADLATAMVMEMTSLQGVIGRIYARGWGESEAVAEAIFEHYLPRFAGDALPQSPAGVAVGLADRIDTLAGLFAAGVKPSGTRDPFALRRTAMGLIQVLVARGVRVDLCLWLEQAGRTLPIPFSEESLQDCLQFIAARHESLLMAEGHRYDVVAAVLAAQGHDPAGAAQAVAELEASVAEAGWPLALQAYARCERIVRTQKVDGRVQAKLFDMEPERILWAAVESLDRPASVRELVADLKSLVPPITEFFDKVLVMDADPAKRANRLALVQRVVTLADGLADLSKLEGF